MPFLKNTVSELVANSTLPLFFRGEVWNYKKKRQRKKCKKVAPGYNRQEGREWIEDLQGGKTGLTGVFVGGLAGRTGGRESSLWLRIAALSVWKKRGTAAKNLGAGINAPWDPGPCSAPYQLCNLGQVIIWLWHLSLGSCEMETTLPVDLAE